MHWIHLTDEQQLMQLISKSQEKPQVIFQHSTPCSITETAKQNLPGIEKLPSADCYFLDIKAYYSLAQKVDELFHVFDKDNELLIIKDGYCLCNKSTCQLALQEMMQFQN